jgi:hypothetical protein
MTGKKATTVPLNRQLKLVEEISRPGLTLQRQTPQGQTSSQTLSRCVLHHFTEVGFNCER